MRPSFQPRLINGPFDDPGLFVSINFRRQAMLFDLGDLAALSPGDILKTSHIFVTHTHIDHFIGFDHLLRLLLGRDKQIHLFGPAGFLDNIAGKLNGYTWNLVQNYKESLTISASEIHSDKIIRQIFSCQKGFKGAQRQHLALKENLLEGEPALEVSAVLLDHQIPCLAYAVRERFHINILNTSLETLGLKAGPWLNAFKMLLFEKTDPGRRFEVPEGYAAETGRIFTIGELAGRIARITPGQKICYITDAAYSPENEAKMVALAEHADVLYIEAAFLDEQRKTARAKNHLTSRQAGIIAGKAGVKSFTLFHHSPRYRHQAHLLNQEAAQAYQQQRLTGKNAGG